MWAAGVKTYRLNRKGFEFCFGRGSGSWNKTGDIQPPQKTISIVLYENGFSGDDIFLVVKWVIFASN